MSPEQVATVSRRRLVGACLMLPCAARAQWSAAPAALPDGPIQIIVPVEPGGGIDAMARLLAQVWAAEHRLSVNVINRPGASGNIATVSVARARPDGQTLLVTGVSHLTSPLLHDQAGYDPIADFMPVARLGTAPNVLLVSDALKGLTLPELIQDPRSRNEGLAFGSAGFGHSSHLAAQVFMARTGVRWLHVPFKGNAPALRALMAGEVQILFLSVPSVPAALASGRAHALAAAHPERLAALPQIPTLAEQGVRQAEFQQWYGLFAPRGTPAAMVQGLAQLVAQGLRTPEARQQLKAHATEAAWLGPDDFTRQLQAQQRLFEPMLRTLAVPRATS